MNIRTLLGINPIYELLQGFISASPPPPTPPIIANFSLQDQLPRWSGNLLQKQHYLTIPQLPRWSASVEL